jgi:hypothetical protein
MRLLQEWLVRRLKRGCGLACTSCCWLRRLVGGCRCFAPAAFAKACRWLVQRLKGGCLLLLLRWLVEEERTTGAFDGSEEAC